MNAMTFEPARAAVMPPGRVWRAYIAEARYETVRMLRAPAFSAVFLSIPVLLFLLFGAFLFGDAIRADPKSALFLFMGFSTFGIMGPGMFGFGITIAMEREQGLLRLKRALPAPPGSVLLAKMFMAMLFAALIMISMIAAAPLGHLRLSAGQSLSVALVEILGAAPFCAIGLFIGTWATGKGAPGFVNLFYLPMIYLSGLFFPLPKSVQWIALVSPAYHLNQLARNAIWAPSQGSPIVHGAVLAGVTVVFTLLAIRRLERVG